VSINLIEIHNPTHQENETNWNLDGGREGVSEFIIEKSLKLDRL
jgi:hypothetical protein